MRTNIVNIFEFHNDPKSLAHFDDAHKSSTFLMGAYLEKDPAYLKQFEDAFLDTPEHVYQYARSVLHRPFKKGTEVISKDAEWATKYAMYVLGKPFLKGEEAISKDSYWSVTYAKSVLEDRFPKGEPAILTNGRDAFDYAKNVISGRWEEAEELLSQHARYSYYYAKVVLGNRFPAGEEVIKGSKYEDEYQLIIDATDRVNNVLKDDPLGLL